MTLLKPAQALERKPKFAVISRPSGRPRMSKLGFPSTRSVASQDGDSKPWRQTETINCRASHCEFRGIRSLRRFSFHWPLGAARKTAPMASEAGNRKHRRSQRPKRTRFSKVLTRTTLMHTQPHCAIIHLRCVPAAAYITQRWKTQKPGARAHGAAREAKTSGACNEAYHTTNGKNMLHVDGGEYMRSAMNRDAYHMHKACLSGIAVLCPVRMFGLSSARAA